MNGSGRSQTILLYNPIKKLPGERTPRFPGLTDGSGGPKCVRSRGSSHLPPRRGVAPLSLKFFLLVSRVTLQSHFFASRDTVRRDCLKCKVMYTQRLSKSGRLLHVLHNMSAPISSICPVLGCPKTTFLSQGHLKKKVNWIYLCEMKCEARRIEFSTSLPYCSLKLFLPYTVTGILKKKCFWNTLQTPWPVLSSQWMKEAGQSD